MNVKSFQDNVKKIKRPLVYHILIYSSKFTPKVSINCRLDAFLEIIVILRLKNKLTCIEASDILDSEDCGKIFEATTGNVIIDAKVYVLFLCLNSSIPNGFFHIFCTFCFCFNSRKNIISPKIFGDFDLHSLSRSLFQTSVTKWSDPWQTKYMKNWPKPR